MGHRHKASLLSIIPGFGQFYNRQWVKGLIYLIISIAFFVVFLDFLNIGLWGLFTLGTETPRDHSAFLLAQGVISVIIVFFALVFYYVNIKDAYSIGETRDNNFKVSNLREQYNNLVDQGYPYLITGPPLVLLIFSTVVPLLFSFSLAFTNYDLYNSPPGNLFTWVGLDTFRRIFTVDIWRSTFFDVLSWTIIWTLISTTLTIGIGILLAVIVNQKDVKFKKAIRTIFILPWAVPGFVTILIFGGLFNETFGVINTQILAFFNISAVSWMTDPTWTRVALILIQCWLGFPFVFLMTTGTLQSIPEDLYEAAIIDGANAIDKFRHITMPILLKALAPIIITQYTGNFNNFNIIYLFNGGGPAIPGSNAGGTDILVSWIYSLTLDSSQYALAAALTILLSLFVVSIALWRFRSTKSFKEVA